MASYTPNRGDIVWLNFTPQAGHEQRGMRPAIVISPAEYNKKTGLAICCPITSNIKGYPFEVEIKGKKINGAILSDHIKNLDWKAREIKFIEKAKTEVVAEVINKISALIIDQ
jgi:mRNA interferase MazF